VRATCSCTDIHHFARALSYPHTELRARARMRVLKTIDKRVRTSRAHERSTKRCVSVNIVRLCDVEVLDVST
jgi:hypothetical protein